MEWLINRRRMMWHKFVPPNYFGFEDQRIWEICAYKWGDTYNLQEVNGEGGVLGTGTLVGDDDNIVYSDYLFAASYAISSHKSTNGTIPAVSARTVQYRVELYADGTPSEAGAPWEIATPSDATRYALYITQCNPQMSATALKSITLESWTDANYWGSQTDLTYNSEKECWECLVTVTNNCQYLRIGLRAAIGVNVSWKIISVGVTKVPLGITLKQCAAVPSLGSTTTLFRGFDGNKLIHKFNEFRYFTNCKAIPGVYGRTASGFESSTLEEIILPDTFINIGDRCFRNCKSMKLLDIPSSVTTIGRAAFWGLTGKVICRPISPPTLGVNNDNTITAKFYVPDDSVAAYKAATNWSAAASRIFPMSEYTE